MSAGTWFCALPREFQDALLSAAVRRTLAKGERLFSRGDAPGGIYAVVSGSIRFGSTGRSGSEQLFAVVHAPVWFGEIAVIDRRPRTHDAVADDDTTLVHVTQAALETMLAREPTWWRHLGALVGTKLRLTFLFVEDTALPLKVRVARRLLLIAERYGELQNRPSPTIDLRQEQLAIMLNTSRQTVNQILKELEARGLVSLSYGRVEVLDIEALRHAAEDV